MQRFQACVLHALRERVALSWEDLRVPEAVRQVFSVSLDSEGLKNHTGCNVEGLVDAIPLRVGMVSSETVPMNPMTLLVRQTAGGSSVVHEQLSS